MAQRDVAGLAGLHAEGQADDARPHRVQRIGLGVQRGQRRASQTLQQAVELCPLGDRVDHAPDQLTDAALALRRAELAAKVLRDDDVGGLLRPALRNFDVVLLEQGKLGGGTTWHAAGRPNGELPLFEGGFQMDLFVCMLMGFRAQF